MNQEFSTKIKHIINLIISLSLLFLTFVNISKIKVESVQDPVQLPMIEHDSDILEGKQVIIKLQDNSSISSFQKEINLKGKTLPKRLVENNSDIESKFLSLNIDELETTIPELEDMSSVDKAFINRPYFLNYTPNDPEFVNQWQLKNGFNGIQAESAWDKLGEANNISNCTESTPECGGSDNVKVAIIDTGVNMSVLSGANFDTTNDRNYFTKSSPCNTSNGEFYSGYLIGQEGNGGEYYCYLNQSRDVAGHGTFVAGVVAMPDDSKSGIGIGYNLEILPIGLEGGAFNTFGLLLAIEHAINSGADIINLSLGTYYDDDGMYFAMDEARKAGVLVVASSGNCGDKTGGSCFPTMSPFDPQYFETNPLIYPAAYSLDNIISVGAVSSDLSRSKYSTYNNQLDIVAPVDGGNAFPAHLISVCGNTAYIPKTGNCLQEGNTIQDIGTSFAAPQVTAAAGLVKSLHPTYNYLDLYEALAGSAKDLGESNKDINYGWGLLYINQALDQKVFQNCDFLDVSIEHPFRSEICKLKEDNIIAGYPDGTYRPDNTVTRGEMSKFMVNAYKITINTSCENFVDVNPGSPFYQEITSLKCNGLINGYPDGTYRLNNPVTRGEMSKFIVNGSGTNLNTSSCQQFSDVNQDYDFADFIQTLRCEGIINGYPDGTYRPNNFVTRAEMSKFIDNSR